MDGELLVRVLGPVVITAGEVVLPVRRPLERGLLVRLALARGVGVPDEKLAADLWDDTDDGDGPPRTARLRVVASRLRSALGPHGGVVVRGAGGYRIEAGVPDLSSVGAAADRLHAAVRAGRHETVRGAAAEALGPWRGPALADLRAFPFARSEGERLDAWRLELTVHRLAAEIALGAGSEVVAELTELSGRNPLHEPLRGMLSVALYRTGRQADALAALAELRRALAGDLGVDPTADTAELELRLLRHDPGLLPTVAATPRRGPAGTDLRPAIARGLVGRRAELTLLAGRLDAALAAEPAIVVVEAGAGMGRTRMLEALDLLGEQHGLVACWGRATAAVGTPPFWPWRQALRQWQQRTDPAIAGPVLARSGRPLATIIPGFGPGTDPAAQEPAVLDPDDRFGLFEHVVAFLADAAATGPGLIVLLDDLHLADLASLLLLGHVARSETTSRLLVAASVRPGELRPDQVAALADVIRQPAASRIELAGLTASAVADQLALVLGRVCDPDVAADVAVRTGGNPLFVREIGRMMAGGGAGVPSGIRDAVRQQLESLPPRCLGVLCAAAVLGGEVDADVVAAAVAEPLAEVLDRLDEAVAAGLLQRGERPDRFRFAHDVVRDAVRLDIGTAERARMHLRAAEHLGSTGARVQQIAHHRLEALPLGDRSQAVGAAQAAADLALRQLAFEDATRLYDRAIDAGSVLDLAVRVELLLGKARAQYLSHDVSAAMRTCEDVAAIAEHHDDPALLGRAATVLHDLGDPAWLTLTSRWCRRALAALPAQDSALRAQLMAQVAVASTTWAADGTDPAETDGIGVAALRMADRVGETTATLAALRARQLARSGPDGVHDRLGFGTRMLGLTPSAGEPAELWGRLWRFDALVQLGRIDEADDELDRLEPVIARMRQPLARWHLVRCQAALLNARGRFAEARAAADQAVAVSRRGHHQAAEYPSHAIRLHIGLLTGDPPNPIVFEVEHYHPPPRILTMMAALWHATHGDIDEAQRMHARLPRPETVALKPFMHLMFHAVSGTLAAAVGDGPAAEHAYAQLLPHAALHVTVGAGVSTTGGSVHLTLGTIAAAFNRTDTAIDHFRAASTANTASGLTPYTALAQARLAGQLRHRSRPGDADEATAAASEASSTAIQLGMPLR